MIELFRRPRRIDDRCILVTGTENLNLLLHQAYVLARHIDVKESGKAFYTSNGQP